MASVAAAGIAPPAPGPAEGPRVRKNFPETWLWNITKASGSDGKAIVTLPAADTITSWVITGISLHPTCGLGLTTTATELIVFQPFFLVLNLPYSAVRGEIVAITIVVFNYLPSTAVVEVSLDNSGREFSFIDILVGGKSEESK